LVDGGIDVLRGPRDYTSVSQALATAGYNGEQIVVVAPTDVQPIRALSLAGTDQLRRAGMNVDFHEMEQGASIRRRQNQAAPDKGGWSAFFGLVDRSLPNNASCSRCPLSTSHGTPASSRALRMIDQILFCGAARFALEPRAIGEPPSCQAAPTVSHPPIIIGGGRGYDNHGYRGSKTSFRQPPFGRRFAVFSITAKPRPSCWTTLARLQQCREKSDEGTIGYDTDFQC
jgi:hypothetical protein